jgi:site-specific DNA-cytosine methylase
MTEPRKRYRALFGFSGSGLGAYGFARASARLLGRDAAFELVGGIDIDPRACADFEYLTGALALRADIAELTADELRAFAGPAAPHAVFCSAPCKGASGLLSNKKAATAHYQKLNRLILDWTLLMLRTWADPPALVLFENVPRVVQRAKEFLDEVRALLRAAGYVLHEGTHDCGEIGGLAQHRRRWLMVGRLARRVPNLLYQPRKLRVRACGEVLGELPMPGDPAAGPMHQLPRISWLNWVRLALIPAGGDWRDLPGMGPRDPAARRAWEQHGVKTAGEIHYFKGKHGVMGWDRPSRTVIGAKTNGAENVADPRARNWFANVLRVTPWDAAAGTVTGAARPSGGALSVADPRPARFNNVFEVVPWDAPVGAVNGGAGPSSGAASVADPRIGAKGHPHAYGVLAWDRPSHTVKGTTGSPGHGPFSVADPRVEYHRGAYGVAAWEAPLGTVTGAAAPSTGRFAVADPRLTCEPRAGAYGVLSWLEAAATVTGSARIDNGPAAVADPRIPVDPTEPPAEPAPVIIAADGCWHRPLTTLELAALQGMPMTVRGAPLVLAGRSAAGWRERIGNGVPSPAAEFIAEQMLLTLLGADAGQFALSGTHSVWVAPPRFAWDGIEVVGGTQ